MRMSVAIRGVAAAVVASGQAGHVSSSITSVIIIITKAKAYGRQGLDWIVGPGYSFVVFSTDKTMETNQKP